MMRRNMARFRAADRHRLALIKFRLRQLFLSALVTLPAVAVFNAAIIETARADEKIVVYALEAPPLASAREPHGFIHKATVAILERAGFEADVQYIAWLRAQERVRETGDALLIPFGRIEGREDNYQWLVPLYDLKRAFVSVAEPVPSLEAAKALDTVGVERGTARQRMLEDMGFENLDAVFDEESNARKLAAGRLDAWAISVPEALLLWQEGGYQQPLQIGAVFGRQPLYIAAGMGFPEDKAERIRKAGEVFLTDGSMQRLIESYR